ncbi:hypothetical protein [Streptomyces sp. NPDC016845]|uniref:hypothetical protein n=1 Tax=Streptomyces sp. NPDC016845 TaxID=3364972 RepID=UPI003797B0DB
MAPLDTPTGADHDEVNPPGRYHVTLIIDGEHILDGWWNDPDTAERKASGFAPEHEDNAGARVTLTEWHGGQEWPLREWPNGLM